RHRPQQQGEMREIAAFGKDADQVCHRSAKKNARQCRAWYLRVVITYRTALITKARMRPSTTPGPNRRARASAARLVASSRRAGSRATISLRNGVPWQ